ncbi:hypothetical protein CYY_004984 [Polysphondylium violaceum]|uniref:RRM domain-containing protein n=1 Tax=Polysphondylium violaceum TaxID=133409 RepID=A0A8J4USJ6_9MYCE|nr:hypothetical protein CYY_004984 [Polysphondylium violaceum]
MDVIIQEPKLFIHSKSSSSSSSNHQKIRSHHRSRSSSRSNTHVNIVTNTDHNQNHHNHHHSKRKSLSPSPSHSPSPYHHDDNKNDIYDKLGNNGNSNDDDKKLMNKEQTYSSRSRSRSRSSSKYHKKHRDYKSKSSRGRSSSRSKSRSKRGDKKKYSRSHSGSSRSRKDRSISKENECRKRYKSKSRSRSRSRDRSKSYDKYKRRKSSSHHRHHHSDHKNSRSRSRERSRRHDTHKGRSRSRSPSPRNTNLNGKSQSRSSSRNSSPKKKSRWSQNTMIEKLVIANNNNNTVNNNNPNVQQDNQSRIYVGSLHFNLTEEDIKQAFIKFGNIKAISLGKEPNGKSKGYCFIEYELPDSASTAIANMQNHIMGGRVIKVARPLTQIVNSQLISLNEDIKNSIYIPNTIVPIVSIQQQQINNNNNNNNNTVNNNNNNNESNRIYIGSIHWNVNEDFLRNSFNKFGKILSCTLMQNTETGKHKGYGFIDFDSKKAADDAISLMNGVEILGRSIKVGKPVKGIASNTSSNASLSSSSSCTLLNVNSKGFEGLEDDSTINSSEQRYLLTQKLLGKDATSKCLVLRNAGSPNDIDETFEEDLRSGCQEFGEIEKMVVKADEIVKVYVLFKDALSCQACQSKLNGKYFSYHCIKAEFYDINLFKNNLFL